MMGIGAINKVYLEFESSFWDTQKNKESFLIASDYHPYVLFFNLKPYSGKNILMALFRTEFSDQTDDLIV